MADQKAPEHIEVESGMLRAGNVEAFRISVTDLRALLSAHGLAIVTEADRKVIEACAAFPIEALTGDLYPSSANRNELSDLSLRWSEAELEARKTRAK